MSARLLIAAALFGATLCSASEPRLRNPVANSIEKDSKKIDTTHDSIVSMEEPQPEDGYDCDFDSGMFEVEKGMSCAGGFKKGSGVGKSCKGGLKAKFDAQTEPDEISSMLADELHPQLASSWTPTKESILQGWSSEELMAEEWTEGKEKSVEFGGFAKIQWGCKVSFKMTDGKLHKKAECGAEAKEGMGKKPTEIELEL